MVRVSNEMLTLMIELEEQRLKYEASFQGECRVAVYLELKQLRKQRECGL